MYTPTTFRMDDRAALHQAMRATPLATLVTATAAGLVATPLPLLLVPDEGPFGTLYGHFARANGQWQQASDHEALVLFGGPDAYVSPSWYVSKGESGRVVPTWNYVAIHAYGRPEYFDDADALRKLVSRLTDLHEEGRENPWAVSDAPEAFIESQLRAIVGLRLPISRIEGKRKMSQNRSRADRAGVAAGLAASDRPEDREAAGLIPLD